MNKLVLSLLAALALALPAGASTIAHYGTNDFSQANVIGIAALSSNVLVSINLVPVVQTNGWVSPAGSNYLGVVPSFAKETYTLTGNNFAPPSIRVLVSTDGTHWTNSPVAAICQVVLLYEGDGGITNLTIWGFDNTSLYKKTNDMRYEKLLVRSPWSSDDAASKAYVDLVHSDLSAWANFPAGNTVNLAGQPLVLNPEWTVRTGGATNDAVLRIDHLGGIALDVRSSFSSGHISGITITTNFSLVTLLVATNGVTSALVPEWSPRFPVTSWTAITNFYSSYPAVYPVGVGSNYIFTFAPPSTTNAFIRMRGASGRLQVGTSGIFAGDAGGLTNLQASAIVGTLPPANLSQLMALLAQPVGSTIWAPTLLSGAVTNETGAVAVNPTNGAVWIKCDGAKLAQTNFPGLYTFLGTNWNGPTLAVTNNAATNVVVVGDGSAVAAWQFRAPDFRGRALIGSTASLSGWRLGGEAEHTLTTNELPAHIHQTIAYANHFVAAGENWLPLLDARNGYGGPNATQTDLSGGGQAHNTLPPFAAGHYWILAGYKLNNLWQ